MAGQSTSVHSAIDRYHLLGLVGNPFSGDVVEADAAAMFVDRGLPDAPPLRAATLVQIIGDRGAGKTTQLAHWRRRVPAPYHYVPPELRARWNRPPHTAVVYGDELDRMPTLLRARWFRWLARHGASLLAGTHVDLERAARRAGLEVQTHHLGPVSLDELSKVITRRLARHALAGKPTSFSLSDDEIAEVHARCNGSLREAEVLCHQLVAGHANASGSVSA